MFKPEDYYIEDSWEYYIQAYWLTHLMLVITKHFNYNVNHDLIAQYMWAYRDSAFLYYILGYLHNNITEYIDHIIIELW